MKFDLHQDIADDLARMARRDPSFQKDLEAYVKAYQTLKSGLPPSPAGERDVYAQAKARKDFESGVEEPFKMAALAMQSLA